ncbi:MAG: antibiotic biosynthesis monooxygenase [Rhodobacteraceae bacterium]|nr:antibiotic biosynthesis monooxygenase [Paracoccaceae bacterium]
MALTIVAELTAHPGKEDALREALKAIIPPTLAEPGCIQYDMHEDNDRPGHFVFYETWENREIWDTSHNVAPHILAFHKDRDALVAHFALYELTRIPVG